MSKTKPTKRPFIGMHYTCCHVYARIYLNQKGDAFVGWCPKCATKTTVRVTPTGRSDRFFSAG